MWTKTLKINSKGNNFDIFLFSTDVSMLRNKRKQIFEFFLNFYNSFSSNYNSIL